MRETLVAVGRHERTEMAVGDHIYVKRGAYTHHGVCVSETTVIHFSGEPGSKQDATIRQDSLDQFAGGGLIRVRAYGVRLDIDETLARARSRVGESGYHLFANNCEHFAAWCVADRHNSGQVAGAAATSGFVGVSALAAAGGVGTVAAAGEVAGLSGAGIMSGLAATGVGGAVGGLATLGVLPGVASAAIMNVALRDNECLPSEERTARRVGRRSSVAGAVVGSAAGISAVSAAGVTGLSAAGITSGLATIGGAVGGGMAAGSAVVIAGPAIAAAAIGYGSYRAVRWAARQRLERGNQT
jgi:hypothetical protein